MMEKVENDHIEYDEKLLVVKAGPSLRSVQTTAREPRIRLLIRADRGAKTTLRA